MTSFDRRYLKPNWENNNHAAVIILGLGKYKRSNYLKQNKDLVKTIARMLTAKHASIIYSRNKQWIDFEKEHQIMVDVVHFEGGDCLKSPKVVTVVSKYIASTVKEWSAKRCNYEISNYWSWLACQVKIHVRKNGWGGRAKCHIYDNAIIVFNGYMADESLKPKTYATIALNLDNDRLAIDDAPIFQ